MKSYYSVQTSEDTSVRIPMLSSLSPDEAILLGAVIASKNSNLADLLERRGELFLGCLLGSLIEGSDDDLGSQESIALSKMLVSDIVTLLFQSFEKVETYLANAGMAEEAEAEAGTIEEFEAEETEESEAEEAEVAEAEEAPEESDN